MKKGKGNMKFGFVIPTYNRPQDLKKCLASLVSQKYQDWCAVVVDDAGEQAIEQTALPDNVHYLKNESNRGVCFSRNRGIDYLLENTAVDYIVFLDDDDWLAQGSLCNANDFIANQHYPHWLTSRTLNPSNFQSITQLRQIKKRYSYLHDCLFGKAVKKDMIHYIKADILRDKSHRFDEAIKSGGEWRFFVRLGEQESFLFFEGGSAFKIYQNDGLTDLNQKNDLFIATERMAMLEYLQNLGQLHRIQRRYVMCCIRKFTQLGEKEHINYLFKNCVSQFNPLWRMFFRLYKIFYNSSLTL